MINAIDLAMTHIARQQEVEVIATLIGQPHQTTTKMSGEAACGALREYSRDHVIGVVVISYGIWYAATYIFKIKRNGEISL